MNIMLLMLFLLVTQIGSFVNESNQSFKDIIPLKTNRATIEKNFKRTSKEDCSNCKYSYSGGELEVRYSGNRCDKDSKGWNLPKDTVLEFTVIPNESNLFKNFPVNKNRLFKFGYDDRSEFHLDRRNGVEYVINPFGYLTKFVYFPKNNIQRLRCKGFPKYDFVGSNYRPDTGRTTTDIEELKDEIERFWFHLLSEKTPLTIYLIVYQGKGLPKTNNEKMLNEVSHFAYKELKMPLKKLKIIKGGIRELPTSEFFVFPTYYPSPLPTPEFPS